VVEDDAAGPSRPSRDPSPEKEVHVGELVSEVPVHSAEGVASANIADIEPLNIEDILLQPPDSLEIFQQLDLEVSPSVDEVRSWNAMIINFKWVVLSLTFLLRRSRRLWTSSVSVGPSFRKTWSQLLRVSRLLRCPQSKTSNLKQVRQDFKEGASRPTGPMISLRKAPAMTTMGHWVAIW